MLNDYRGKAVLVTGGTMGIGLATGLAFGRQGARAFLTHRWGSADEDGVRRAFAGAGAPEPVIVEADVSREEDTLRLMDRIREDHERLEVLVSNVCVVQVAQGLMSLSRRAMTRSLEYSAWPLVSYLQQARATLGRWPRYVVGISSDGPDVYYYGYDYVAVSKVVMEVLGRYLAAHLLDEDVRVNMVRTRNVLTSSSLAIHGQDYPDFIRRFGGQSHVVEAGAVGDAVLALCSGLMDALSGQVINVDRGGTFCDNIMRIYRHRREYGLEAQESEEGR